MTEDILDSNHESKSNRKFNWTIWIAPVFVLIGLVKCQQNGILLNSSVIITLILFVLSVLGNLIRPDFGMIVSTLIFVLAMFGVCQLFPRQEYFGFGFGSVPFKVEVYALLLLIGHVVLTSKSHQQLFSFLKKNKT